MVSYTERAHNELIRTCLTHNSLCKTSFKTRFSTLIFTSLILVRVKKNKKPRRFRRISEAYIDRELISL